MPRKYECGEIVTGTVTGIQAYGAFVSLDDTTQGLIHISEITNGYVKDVGDFLKVGDVIEVRVLSTDYANGKISLSLKAAHEEQPMRRQTTMKVPKPASDGFNTLRKKLNEWIEQSQRQNATK
ncbi:S1 domain-containing post-transcriptional regulator GSP13 [Ectobacillus sp. JY-23]|uniref:S1 domain-containing post-transcriptional regulator GSP13 n=1 Tax=Ectobacillus sp. JY-23 TaxID=2933872 RepID=UPI001FF144AE|nr:S1 domain-containing post-transcriptional regulator GSP13 [Ectobacillus sp. JY-23]UOY90947.1 S1 domain-containing post-transcriptional regulator GSP13 [Ectobacillus sp. JY-23]